MDRRLFLTSTLSCLVYPTHTLAQDLPKRVRVIVALADNQYQGIVPVPSQIGNGQDPKNNLYWGAMYGVKSYFRRDDTWSITNSVKPVGTPILEMIRFKSTSGPKTIVQAEAWDGRNMKSALTSFFDALNNPGDPNQLVVFVGHNGLMDVNVTIPSGSPESQQLNIQSDRQAIVLACQSDDYMSEHISKLGVTPLVMTQGNMAPEAYSLEAAIEAWRHNQDSHAVRGSAAKAYAKYQKLPLRNARWLFGAK